MNDPLQNETAGQPVPAEVIPPGSLPPMTWRDLPEPIPIRRMIGPSVILAGLALGSGEFIIWPYITYKSQFVFFWACIVGVVTQFFLNMEIARWTLATGESAVTGFIRLGRWWAGVFLVLNIVPWMIPAWSKGAAQILSWLVWGPAFDKAGNIVSLYETEMAIAGMVICGAILTAGPVIYETMEKVQILLVSLVMILVVVLAVWLVWGRPDAVIRQFTATVTFGAPQFFPPLDAHLSAAMLLGALAFAGAGGTTNLGQSNYIKEKGYGMGRYIGRLTSPLTGREEPVSEVGYHFPPTDENMARWRHWWRSANIEHSFSFLLTCIVCLVLLSLISYTLFYNAAGQPRVDIQKYQEGLGFIWAEANLLTEQIGGVAKLLFLVMGMIILLTTEFGVLDVASRISTDAVKVAWLRDNPHWSESRMYYWFLWGMIVLGSGILLLGNVGVDVGALRLFKFTSAMNGAVMFLYSGLLLYMNTRVLPPSVRLRGWRVLTIVWAVLFFGFFSVLVAVDVVWPLADLAR